MKSSFSNEFKTIMFETIESYPLLTNAKGRRQSASPLLKELGWLPAKERIIAKVTTLAYRCRLSPPPLAPAYISSLLSEHVPARSLRSSSTISLSVPRVRLAAFGQRSFSFLAPTLFNSLPPAVSGSPNLSTFKARLKSHLLLSAFSQ